MLIEHLQFHLPDTPKPIPAPGIYLIDTHILFLIKISLSLSLSLSRTASIYEALTGDDIPGTLLTLTLECVLLL